MRILNKKISLVAIFIISITIILSIYSISSTEPQTTIQNSSTSEEYLVAQGTGATTYSEEEDKIPQAYLNYSFSAMEYNLKEIVKRKDDKVTIDSVTQVSPYYLMPDNISQSELNNEYKKNHNIAINGTCTLVAMVSAILYIEKINDELAITYDNLPDSDKAYKIFEELYNISVDMGNNYSNVAGARGTAIDTIEEIFWQFYYNHGHQNVNINDYLFTSNVQNNVYNTAYAPSILSLYDYWVNGEFGEFHSVVLCGYYEYKVIYRLYPWYKLISGVKHTAYYKVFVVCNGWSSANDYEIGNHFQLLVYDDNAYYSHICNVEDWLDYYE